MWKAGYTLIRSRSRSEFCRSMHPAVDVLLRRSHRIAWLEILRYESVAADVQVISFRLHKPADRTDALLPGRSPRTVGEYARLAQSCGSSLLWLLGLLLRGCPSHGRRIGLNGYGGSTAYQRDTLEPDQILYARHVLCGV